MNSFVLMATVIREPELRFTKDNQTPVCEFLVEFPGIRDDSPKESLKVVGWGNLANTIKETYHPGDRLIIEGRLGINTVERQEGFKEKRAELTAARISLVDGGNAINAGGFPPPVLEPVDLNNTDDIPF
ncbi:MULTISPECIES: single-stranded DNA-binding protein [unclassified Synechocystis]|uniref:single-stranded DNA-binding protein n=1 Tax=unclassified Synechocystis TaxID=2640012 RepID=UPI000400A21B|nr:MULTISPECIES: single-stranded DNA-binding protein [unclassified Synechocystis]AIE73453.1 Single-stranded DNA-binding protein [Synechocystis sp. PCC 6714]MCT0254190.1 single-stranded DNA-binding protein [Synechocystis sp. CS-94]